MDRTPIAAASLAQVHRAVDTRGRDVAVKVQYPHLAKQLRMDLKVIQASFAVSDYFFPDVALGWMYPECEAALTAEVHLVLAPS